MSSLSKVAVVVGLLVAVMSQPVAAAVTPEDRTRLAAIEAALERAAYLLRAGKTAEAGQLVTEAQAVWNEMAKRQDPELAQYLAVLETQLKAADNLLKPGQPAQAGQPNRQRRRGAAAGANAAGAGATTSSSNNTVSFLRDLAPVIVENCVNCHAGRQPPRQFGLDRFDRLMRGGLSGEAIIAGKPTDSLLIHKLRGTDEPQMPLRRPPLSEETIAKFETWIREGATYDGPDPSEPIERALKRLIASGMSHADLAKERVDAARANWRLGLPDVTPEEIDTKNFFIMGDLPPVQLKEVATAAEAELKKLIRQLKAPGNEPFIKGRLTLFAFQDRLNYQEFVQMVEKRELPTDRSAHWRYTVVDAYVCILFPEAEKHAPSAQLAEQVAGAWIDSRMETPAWFAAGFARSTAARAEPRDPLVREWEGEIRRMAGSVVDASFIDSDAVASQDAAMSYAFVQFLTTGGRRYDAFLDGLRNGAEFDAAFESAFGGAPKAVAEKWLGSAR